MKTQTKVFFCIIIFLVLGIEYYFFFNNNTVFSTVMSSRFIFTAAIIFNCIMYYSLSGILFNKSSSDNISGVVVGKSKNNKLTIEIQGGKRKTIKVTDDVYNNTYMYSYYGSNITDIKPKEPHPLDNVVDNILSSVIVIKKEK